MYGEGACIIAALHLTTSGMHDIAALDCELYRLNLLVAADAAPWDNIATACVAPRALTDTDACERIPTVVVNNVAAYPLYRKDKGDAFLTSQTGLQLDDCNRWFPLPIDEDQCSCSDVAALKTLGSPQRNRIIRVHNKRVSAANAVRDRRTRVIEVLEKAIRAALVANPTASSAARALYSDISTPEQPVEAPAELHEIV